MDNKPTTAELIILVSGAAVFVFSFFDMFEGTKAWDIWPFLFVAVFALVMAAVIALARFANVSLPANLAGLSWPTVHLMLGFYCAALMIAQLLESTTGSKIGFWVMLIGSIGLLVGAFLLNQERSGVSRPGAGPGPGPTV